VSLGATNILSWSSSPALEGLLQSRIDELQRRQSITVAFALLLVAVAFFMGLRLMYSISRPLDQLHRATGRLAGGDLAARVEITGASEVAQVGRAFNSMAQEVQAGREQLERRVAERTEALAAATREAQEARIAAEAATRAKSAFLANMSHELRTPLNAIIGYSEMLQEEAQEQGYGELAPDLEKIRTAGKHLLALINDILDLSKIEAGRMELHLERFSLAALLDEALNTIAPLIERGGNTLEVRGDRSGYLFADMTKLRQALLNLLSNAAKFTEAGRITLTIDTLPGDGGELLRLQVSDTGIGMSREELSRLFREFTQGDPSTTRKYGGTGLGLALSRRFCQMMGGDITVTSAPGAGSTFTIVVPWEVVPPQPTPAGQPGPDEPGDQLVGPTRGTVLVIDDDPATQELLRRTLAREGMGVAVAASGEDGLARARALRPDLITLDVLLKGADGWQVLAALKADPALAAIPVVMLTIMDERSTGFALGAADYLTKPIDRRRLVELVSRHCGHGRPGEAGASDVLIVEDDHDTREMLARTLAQAGWRTRSAENGLVGLAEVAGTLPGLIILDLMLPELDGFGFLAELRANRAWAAVPVVVVTAMDLTVEERARLSRSAQRVLQKGAYDRDSLLREVRSVVAAQLQPAGRAS
jgi:signal transduction histidine kinase/DNA-binding response OmpR family regulator